MYNDGLIYRGDRIVNWCSRCESTLADDEVEYRDQKAKLYYFKYNKDFPITIATTRPETKLGDTAIAVNPKDERYKKYIGQIFEIDLGNGAHKIKIIADRGVDVEFGTGALGVTPAHSMTDWEMAQKNNLEKIKIIGEDGKVNANAGKSYKGLTVLEAREKFVEYLRKNNLIEKIEEVDQSLSICYRCNTPIEPLPSLQWFVDVDKKITIDGNKYFQNKSLKEVALKVVNSGEIEIIPKRFEKIYFHWMENLHDWCISRQLWFGHRIPVWYKESKVYKVHKVESQEPRVTEGIYVGTEPPKGEGWAQDKDTLDTWFSSGLWTFSTLLDQDHKKYKTFENWIAGSPDLKKYHPTSVMETGYDILFFWVARMILMTTYTMGEVPFEKVYLHGMVRDKQGRKMSKSLGNGIDPVEMIERYGTDALRLSMIIGSSPGNDIRLYEEKIEGYRNFVNKLWNIARYIILSRKSKVESQKSKINYDNLTLADKWILEHLENLKRNVANSLESYQFSSAFEGDCGIRGFMWDKLADWYLEISKIQEKNDKVLIYVLETLLKLCHPFIPFVTERIWQEMEKENLLIVEEWPKNRGYMELTQVNLDFDMIQGIVKGIRSVRNDYGIASKEKVDVVINAETRKDLTKKDIKVIEDNKDIIIGLAGLKSLKIESEAVKPKGWVYFDYRVSVYVNIGDLIDVKKETGKIKKETENVKRYINQVKNKLDNKKFIANAPQEIVEKEKEKLKKSEKKLGKLEEKLRSLL